MCKQGTTRTLVTIDLDLYDSIVKDAVKNKRTVSNEIAFRLEKLERIEIEAKEKAEEKIREFKEKE